MVLGTFDAYDLVYLPFHRDTDTLVGLPRPIHESVKTLKQVTRVGSQSSGIGSQQGKLGDYQSPEYWLFYQTHSEPIILYFPCRHFGQRGRN